MHDSHILTMLDSCRPGRDDRSLPEVAAAAAQLAQDADLRAAFVRSQRFDMAVADAIDDVSIPAGLAERLLAKVKLAEAAPQAPDEPAAGATLAQLPDRRRLLLLAAHWAIAASLLLTIVAVSYWAFGSRKMIAVGEEQLAASAADWHLHFLADAQWSAEQAFPASLAPSTAVVRARRFADISRLVGQPAAIYDLSLPNQRQATLVVVQSKAPGLSVSPPQTPRTETANLSVGCWRGDGVVYLLVVQGDASAYRQFLLRSPSGLT